MRRDRSSRILAVVSEAEPFFPPAFPMHSRESVAQKGVSSGRDEYEPDFGAPRRPERGNERTKD